MKSTRWSVALLIAIAAFTGLGAVRFCAVSGPHPQALEGELNYLPHPRFIPSWTPDGQHIVFDRYVIDVGGTDLRSIVPESLEGGVLDYQFSSNVSPVESRVAYMTLRHGDGVLNKVHSWDIVTSGIDGTDYKRLTSEESFDSNPVWSPDGKRIAFHSDRDGSYDAPFSLFVMDNDGSNVRNLTPGIRIIRPELPVWSPGSDRIVFWAYVPSSQEEDSNDWALHVVNADGSGLKMISRTASHLAWSPDGGRLAFMMNDRFENEVEKPTLAIAELGGNSDVRHIPIQPKPEAPGEHIVRARALVWSQDGSKLEVVTCHEILIDDAPSLWNTKVYSVDTDGETQPELVARWSVLQQCLNSYDISSGGYEMAWSPDRSQMAVLDYSRIARIGRHPFFNSLYVISADGTGFKHLVIEGENRQLVAANASQ